MNPSMLSIINDKLSNIEGFMADHVVSDSTEEHGESIWQQNADVTASARNQEGTDFLRVNYMDRVVSPSKWSDNKQSCW